MITILLLLLLFDYALSGLDLSHSIDLRSHMDKHDKAAYCVKRQKFFLDDGWVRLKPTNISLCGVSFNTSGLVVKVILDSEVPQLYLISKEDSAFGLLLNDSHYFYALRDGVPDTKLTRYGMIDYSSKNTHGYVNLNYYGANFWSFADSQNTLFEIVPHPNALVLWFLGCQILYEEDAFSLEYHDSNHLRDTFSYVWGVKYLKAFVSNDRKSFYFTDNIQGISQKLQTFIKHTEIKSSVRRGRIQVNINNDFSLNLDVSSGNLRFWAILVGDDIFKRNFLPNRKEACSKINFGTSSLSIQSHSKPISKCDFITMSNNYHKLSFVYPKVFIETSYDEEIIKISDVVIKVIRNSIMVSHKDTGEYFLLSALPSKDFVVKIFRQLPARQKRVYPKSIAEVHGLQNGYQMALNGLRVKAKSIVKNHTHLLPESFKLSLFEAQKIIAQTSDCLKMTSYRETICSDYIRRIQKRFWKLFEQFVRMKQGVSEIFFVDFSILDEKFNVITKFPYKDVQSISNSTERLRKHYVSYFEAQIFKIEKEYAFAKKAYTEAFEAARAYERAQQLRAGQKLRTAVAVLQRTMDKLFAARSRITSKRDIFCIQSKKFSISQNDSSENQEK